MKIELTKDGSHAVIETVGACVEALTIGGEECVIDKRGGIGGGIDAVLFPIVGRQNGGDYTVNGEEYKLPIHGFLKQREMKVRESGGDFVILTYRATDEDKKIYPFDFEYTVKYALRRRKLYQHHVIINRGDEPMYYSFGLHPSFMLDGAKYGKTNTGTDILRFRKQIEPHVWRLDQKGHFVVGKEEFAPIKQVETTAETVEKYGTLMLCDAPFRDIKLYTRGGSLWEIGLLPSPPVLALWGEPQGEDGYICVEPWWGLNDFADRERELTKKQGFNMLLPGNSAHYHAMFKKVR